MRRARGSPSPRGPTGVATIRAHPRESVATDRRGPDATRLVSLASATDTSRSGAWVVASRRAHPELRREAWRGPLSEQRDVEGDRPVAPREAQPAPSATAAGGRTRLRPTLPRASTGTRSGLRAPRRSRGEARAAPRRRRRRSSRHCQTAGASVRGARRARSTSTGQRPRPVLARSRGPRRRRRPATRAAGPRGPGRTVHDGRAQPAARAEAQAERHRGHRHRRGQDDQQLLRAGRRAHGAPPVTTPVTTMAATPLAAPLLQILPPRLMTTRGAGSAERASGAERRWGGL